MPTSPAQRWRRPAVLLVFLPSLWLGCAPGPGPAPPGPSAAADTTGAPPESVEIASDSAAASDSATVPIDQTIPPDYLPPPGQCRLWRPGEPVGDQEGEHPVGRCSDLRQSLPEDAWLIYRPADVSGIVRVWRYAEDGGVLSQRIHDAETGELLRHVAPAGS